MLPTFTQLLQLAADWSLAALEIIRKQRWFTALPTPPSALPLQLRQEDAWVLPGGEIPSTEGAERLSPLRRWCVGCLPASEHKKGLGKVRTGSSWSTSSCSWERSPTELTLASSRCKPRWMSMLLCIHLKYYDSLQYMGELCLRQTWHKSTAGWIIPVTFSTAIN